MAEDNLSREEYLKKQEQEIGRLRIQVIQLRKENQELQNQKQRAEEQCKTCRDKLFEQVMQRPDIGCDPSLPTHKRTSNDQKLQEQMHRLTEQLADSQRREIKLKERLDNLELSSNGYSKEDVGKMMIGKEMRFENEKAKMRDDFEEEKRRLVIRHEGEVRLLKDEIKSLKEKNLGTQELHQSRIQYEEMMEQREREVNDLKLEIKKYMEEQREHEEGWKLKETQWLQEKEALEGDLRTIHLKLPQEHKKNDDNHHSKQPVVLTQRPQTSVRYERKGSSPVAETNKYDQRAHSENVLAKECSQLEAEIMALEKEKERLMKERTKN